MKTNNEISDFLAQTDLGRPAEISFLAQGENNRSYRLDYHGGESYVLRCKRDVSTEGSLENEHLVLSFLSEAAPGLAPESVLYDGQAGVHVMSCVPGREIGPANFTVETTVMFAQKLAALHAVTLADYQSWRESQGMELAAVETLDETFDIYFRQSFDYIDAHCPDRELAEWIGPQVDAMQMRIKDHDQWPATLSHGDIGGNMLWDGNDLTFIDWERARFMHSHELGYCFVHGKCPENTQKAVLDAYCDAAAYDGDQREKLRAEVDLQMQFLRLDAVIWSAKRYSELSQAGDETADDYLQRARENMQTYLAHYPTPLRGAKAAPSQKPGAVKIS